MIISIDIPLRRVRLSTDAFLSIMWDAFNQTGQDNKGSICIGGLRGKRAENMVYVTNVVSEGSVCREPLETLEDLLELLGKTTKREESGMEVVGWYIISPTFGLDSTDALEQYTVRWQSTYPGSFLLILDPKKMLQARELIEFIRIYSITEHPDHDIMTYHSVPSIYVDLGIGDLIRALRNKLVDEQIETVLVTTNGEGPGEKKRTREKLGNKNSIHTPGKGAKKREPLQEIDDLSNEILKLKAYLVKLKRALDSGKNKDTVWFTKRVKFLKLKQLSLSDRITEAIKGTTDIQMRIALHKVRDSLGIDMKLVDDLINEQYLHTLADLVRMGAETNEE